MKHIYFYRESNKFEDILNDPILKKELKIKISWTNHLLIGFSKYKEDLTTYIVLKYGDDVKTEVVPDRSPKIYVDYKPKFFRRKES